MAAVIQTPLELAFVELLKAVVGRNVSAAKFKTKLEQLEKTLKSIEPMFYDSSRLNQVLDRPETETTMFVSYLEERKMLIQTSNLLNVTPENLSIRNEQNYHQLKLGLPWPEELGSLSNLEKSQELAQSIEKVNWWMNQHESELHNSNVVEDDDRVDQSFMENIHEEAPSIGCMVHEKHSFQSCGSDFSYDSLPSYCDVDPRCRSPASEYIGAHNRIKDIFGENILYVTVSIPFGLKLVVHNLFEHFGENHCDFQTDGEARNLLKKMMPVMGSNEILLVPDDVWSESESVIQDLRFPILGYKILVTSRFLFPRFHSTYELRLLTEKDARTPFCYSAFPNDWIPVDVPDDNVNKIVKLCKKLPLALIAAGSSLRGQPSLKWRTLKKMSDGHPTLSQKSRLDALDEFPIVKDCFLDMGLFPADERIAAMALVDMWVELCDLDDEEMKEVGEQDGYCEELYVNQEVLLRELAIHLSSQEPTAERNRLFIDVHGNEFPTWWIEQIAQPMNTKILSSSTGEPFVSNWYDIAPKAEVLTLNIHSEKYTLPRFIERMNLPKVSRIMSFDLHPQPYNLPEMGYFFKLKRITFEDDPVSYCSQILSALENCHKLADFSCTIKSSPVLLPNPTSLVLWKKLSITHCHQLDLFPEELGSLSNLEKLVLPCCTKPQDLPQSIVKLNWWINHEIDPYNLNVNVVEDDDGVESFMENIYYEKAPSFGCMVHEKRSFQSSGSDLSYDSPPSCCGVAPRCGSPDSEYMARDGQCSCSSDFSGDSPPSYCGVAPRCASFASSGSSIL